MKLVFEQSQLDLLIKLVKDNPQPMYVLLTASELNAIYEELIAAKNSMAVLIKSSHRQILIDGRWIQLRVTE